MKSKISLMFVAACSALCIASLPAQAGSASKGSTTSTKISGVKIGSKVSKGSTIVTTSDETQGQTTLPPDTLPGIVSDYYTIRTGTYSSGSVLTSGRCPASSYSYIEDSFADSTAANFMDHRYVQGNWNGITWDLGTGSSLVAGLGAIDHGPVPIEAMEFALRGSNDMTNWENGINTKIIQDGWVDIGTTEESDDWATIWSFTQNYRYIKAVANYDGDFEIDAVAAVTPKSSRMLTLSTDAGSCTVPGSTVNVTASLSGVYENVVAGQIWLTWDSSKLTLNSIAAGDAPFVVNYTINQSAGTAFILASITPGSNGGPVVNAKAVAKLAFTATGENCSGAGNKVDFYPPGTMPTIFTDGFGATISPALTASAGFTVDGTKPVLSGAVDVTQNADAGDGPFAVVAITKPTANDNCAGATSVSGVRSDSLALTAKYPVGTTVITWSSTDPCGNTGKATSNIVVRPYNTVKFNVTYASVSGGAATRGFVTSMRGPQITYPTTVSGVSVASGVGAFFENDAPIDNYFCATVEDPASTLRRQASVTDAGTNWSVNVTLLSGDIINDELVDVLDWGAYVVRNPNADLNMDNSTNATDGNMIIANFGRIGDAACGSSFTGSHEPIMAISVRDLVSQGLVELVGADLNNDGWLDMEDVRMGTRGARLNRDGWVDVAVSRSAK